MTWVGDALRRKKAMKTPIMVSGGGLCGSKRLENKRLENIEEDATPKWLPVNCAPPETPTESMEFLARSWSLSAKELSKALTHPCAEPKSCYAADDPQLEISIPPRESGFQPLSGADSPPISPRGSDDAKELFLLHQALNPDFLSGQQLLKTGIYRSIARGRTVGRWLKDQKEKRKQEIRTQNAQLHAAVSVAGVAAAVAALAASIATSPEKSSAHPKTPSKTSAAFASAAALVASHCVEIAEDMGAEHDQILSAISSAISARTNGDIMALTAGAATALRGAAILKARLQKGNGSATIAMADEQVEENKEPNISIALNFVSKGGVLLKRTRKGALHWKQVSFTINSNWQVIAKMKSKHMAGTFTKKKKCAVSEIYGEIPAWTGRDREDCVEKRAYFGIQTAERIIEFECRSKGDKELWIEGIQHMMNCRNLGF